MRRFAFRRSRRIGTQSGAALLTALLLLVLVSILGLAMAVTTNSDMMINGYYGSYRGSFYAADSGLNIARATMVSQIESQVNMHPCLGWGASATDASCQSAPLNGASAAGFAQTHVPSAGFSTLNAGQAANSWPENYMIPATMTGCATGVTFASSQVLTTQGTLNTSYAYTFNYTLCAVGQAQALQQVATKESGILTVTITAGGPNNTPTQTTFSSFGKFTLNFNECQGGLVSGTITGPLWTNGSWNFGTSGSYIFTDPVSQVDPKASFIFSGGHCDLKNASSDTYSGQTIAPTFQSGFNRGQPPATPPPNDYVQQWAVMDGVGCGEGGTTCGVTPPPYPTNAQLNATLKKIDGNTSYPTGGASSGVFLPYCTTACTGGNTPNTVYGGGIFVEGDASIQLQASSSGNPTQTYIITQQNSGGSGGHRGGSGGGSGTTVTTITVNITANTTTIAQPGVTTKVLTGVPMNKTVSPPIPGTMLYVDGDITGLAGPGQGVASIQDYYATTISANGDINITGDLIYKHEPVTLDTSNALIPGNDFNQVLGLYTANGNIVITSPYGNNNLETDASLAAIASPCPGGSSSCGFATVSGGVNKWTIVGGQTQANVHSVSISQRNTYFDRRFTSRTDGFAPPWFPTTTVPGAAISGSASQPSVIGTTQRTTWVTWPQ
jgi:Tfp pilus assembly protein PilX